MNPTLPEVLITVEEVLSLMQLALERDDIDRAVRWAGVALSVNDDAS